VTEGNTKGKNDTMDSNNNTVSAADRRRDGGLSVERIKALRNFEQMFSYHFDDISLLDNALTHRSFVHENQILGCKDNERLEFLGDAVIDLFVTDLLMKRFPDYTEGQLSKLRASLVNEYPLADLAQKFKVGDYLLLGKGEESTGGRMKTSLLANTLEAIIAAVYLDSNMEKTKEFLKNLIKSLVERGEKIFVYKDYKTSIQEISQNCFKEAPRYVLLGEYGPDHNKTFKIGVYIGDIINAYGTGKSKKEAEQDAARKVYKELQKNKGEDLQELA